MTDTQNVAIIVDAYSSGELYPAEFSARGWKCVHVQSSPAVPPEFVLSFRPGDFIANLRFDGDSQRLLAALREFPVRVATAGTDTGVELADTLGEWLGLPGNGIHLRAERHDKGLMGETVARTGLRTPRQFWSHELQPLRGWIHDGPGLPVVLKPTQGYGSERIALCETDDDLERAFAVIAARPNARSVEPVVVQEVLRGTEYVVDTVSWAERRCVTDIWRYDKRTVNGVAFIYHAAELLPYEGDVQRQLVNYTYGVLDALGHRFGPAHTEVIMTGTGPVLVETASRPHGGHAPAICRACIGFGQIDRMVDACVDPALFERHAGQPFSLQRQMTIVFLISTQEGRLRGLPRLPEICALPSFHDLSLRVRPSEPLRRTVDLFSGPGVVVLMHEDKTVIDADVERIRAIERDGFYDVEPQAF